MTWRKRGQQPYWSPRNKNEVEQTEEQIGGYEPGVSPELALWKKLRKDEGKGGEGCVCEKGKQDQEGGGSERQTKYIFVIQKI